MTSTTSLFDEGFTLERDVSYLGPDREEKLDVYLPAASFPRPLPAVLLIHGGGWRLGDKASARERNIGSILASHGYAVFSINYLLNQGHKDDQGILHTTRVAWPQNFYDCKSAIRFMRKESSRWGIDPARLAVMGGSAGGSFSMLLAATPDVDELNRGGLYRDQSSAVSCIINFYGISDLRIGQRRRIFAGATDQETEDNIRLASPLTWIRPGFPPILVVHGSADPTVPVDASRDLVPRLQELSIDYWYVELAGAPHSFHLQPSQMDLRPVVLQFLQRHL